MLYWLSRPKQSESSLFQPAIATTDARPKPQQHLFLHRGSRFQLVILSPARQSRLPKELITTSLNMATKSSMTSHGFLLRDSSSLGTLKRSRDQRAPLTPLMACLRKPMVAKEILLRLIMLRLPQFQHVILTMAAKPRLPLLP